MKEFKYGLATVDEMGDFIGEAEEMIKKYGWEDRNVHPFERPINIGKVIEYLRDYEECTVDSKWYLLDYANGLAKIMNVWEEQEKTYITVRSISSGKTVKIDPDLADIYLDNGFEII